MTLLRPHQLLRTRICLPAQIELPSGERPQAQIEELTVEGLSFCCDRATSLQLLPDPHQAPGNLFGVRVVVSFTLPGQTKAVRVPCRLVLCRRYAQDRYRFEGRFDPRETLQQQCVETFLKRHHGRRDLPIEAEPDADTCVA